jgi:hypothetical protein
MTNRSGYIYASVAIPYKDFSFVCRRPARRYQPAAVGRIRACGHAKIMAGQLCYFLSRPGIPDPQRRVIRTRRYMLAVWMESATQHSFLMTAQGRSLTAGVDAPSFQSFVRGR